MLNTELVSGIHSTNLFELCTPRQLLELLDLVFDDEGSSPSVSLIGVASNRTELVRTIGELLEPTAEYNADVLSRIASREISFDELQRIKAVAKLLQASESDLTRRAAAIIVYHAAIAAALVHHGATITSIPGPERVALYVDLATAMAPHEMSDVFREAADQL